MIHLLITRNWLPKRCLKPLGLDISLDKKKLSAVECVHKLACKCTSFVIRYNSAPVVIVTKQNHHLPGISYLDKLSLVTSNPSQLHERVICNVIGFVESLLV
ncbi:hypothetical protein T02_11700 [Trichinella nativa]|uniref:Uncharacterized protein n=1 Tax=Trichinella nativa TaxID=6335 RepID=A0A0V1LNV6_9BILA|nr:hypothetical protein T02_11700 [Trichinella nativa]